MYPPLQKMKSQFLHTLPLWENNSTQRCSSLLKILPQSFKSSQQPKIPKIPNCCLQICHHPVETAAMLTAVHRTFYTWWFISLLCFLSALSGITLCFCSAMFRCGMQKDIRTHWNRAAQCNQWKTKTTKNLLQIHISSTSFLNSGNLEMFHNELKDWTKVWTQKKDCHNGPMPKLKPWKSLEACAMCYSFDFM